MAASEPGLEELLGLGGTSFFVDEQGRYRVKFVVKRVPVTSERPHGLMCSLTLFDESNDRLVGFDNAHPVTGRSARHVADRDTTIDTVCERSGRTTIRPYDYKDAASLLADFWEQVDSALKERGVLP